MRNCESNDRSVWNRASTLPVLLAAVMILCVGIQAEAAKLPPPTYSDEMPYKPKYVTVHGSRMHYVEAGSGDPIVFLHGQPTSSYLWRNIMPHVERSGRVIAPDNIGFGKSDKPDLDYTFEDHMRYIDGFIEALGLRNITFVTHDWGGPLAYDYAMRHEENVKGLVMMETFVGPLWPAASYEALPKFLGDFFSLMRSEKGTQMMVEDNYFVEGVLFGFSNRDLTDKEKDVYRAPFMEKSSRNAIVMWPNQVPIGGAPPYTVKLVREANEWMQRSSLPKLLFHVEPGALVPLSSAEWAAKHLRNVEVVYLGQGMHYIQETHPDVIGRSIADWYRRNVAR